MDHFRDAAIMERVLQCVAAQARLEVIRKNLKGKSIKEVEFTNDGNAVGVLLTFDDGQQVLVLMKELGLHLLLRDPHIARQEWELYHNRYAYPIPVRRKRRKHQSQEGKKEESRMLRFSDGVNLDTSGPLRAVELHDGWYVLGDGMSVPCDSKEQAEETIRQMTAGKGAKTNEKET